MEKIHDKSPTQIGNESVFTSLFVKFRKTYPFNFFWSIFLYYLHVNFRFAHKTLEGGDFVSSLCFDPNLFVIGCTLTFPYRVQKRVFENKWSTFGEYSKLCVPLENVPNTECVEDNLWGKRFQSYGTSGTDERLYENEDPVASRGGERVNR